MIRIDALETRHEVAAQPAPRKSPLLAIGLTTCAVAIGLFFVAQQRNAVGHDLARIERAAQQTDAHLDNLATAVDKVAANGQLTQSKLAALSKRPPPRPPRPATKKSRPRGGKPKAVFDTSGPDCDPNDPICGAGEGRSRRRR